MTFIYYIREPLEMGQVPPFSSSLSWRTRRAPVSLFRYPRDPCPLPTVRLHVPHAYRHFGVWRTPFHGPDMQVALDIQAAVPGLDIQAAVPGTDVH